jgi:hypothetical protein
MLAVVLRFDIVGELKLLCRTTAADADPVQKELTRTNQLHENIFQIILLHQLSVSA